MTFQDAVYEAVISESESVARRSKGLKNGPSVMCWEAENCEFYFSTEGISLSDLKARDWYAVKYKR